MLASKFQGCSGAGVAEKKKENAVLARRASKGKELALWAEFGHADGNRAALNLG